MTMLLAVVALLIAAAEPAPDWQPYPMRGGTTWLAPNSVLDNGRYRSILFRIDGQREGIGAYVIRVEVDCSARMFRARNLVIYGTGGGVLLNHRLPARAFSGPGQGMRVIEAACAPSSPPRDPVPADAPSTYSVAVATICSEVRQHREAGDADWLDRVTRAMELTDDQRIDVRLSCEAYESGRSGARR